MHYSDTEIIRIIKQSTREPDDLNTKSIVIRQESAKPLLFTPFEGNEALAYKEKQLNCFTATGKRIVSKHETAHYTNKSYNNAMWDVDVQSGSGVFDSQGQFISTTESNPDKTSSSIQIESNDNTFVNYENSNPVDDENEEIFWVVKTQSRDGKEKIEGPFTTEEIQTIDLTGKFIKRTVDKKFVEIDKVEVCEDFFKNFDSARINEEIQKKENLNKTKNDLNEHDLTERDLNSELKELKISKSKDDKTNSSNEKWFLNCIKTEKFLKRRKCDLDLLTIEKEIRGLTKKEAKIKLSKISNLSEIDSLDVLNLLVCEAKKEILSDVDKDGFMKVKN